MQRRFFRVPVKEIAYIRAILEGYDGVAQLHVPDANRGEMEWQIGIGLEAEAQQILERLQGEVRLVEILPPNDWP